MANETSDKSNAAFKEAEARIRETLSTDARVLNLSRLGLTELPESLAQLTQLQELHLHDNQLTSVPEWLGQLAQLQRLDLSNNQLTRVPESLGQLTQLQRLYIHNNQLISVPESLGQLTQLQRLYLFDNRLTVVAECIGRLTQLRELRLFANQLTAVPDCLGNLTQLWTLGLSSNQLTAMPESLGQLIQLRELRLFANRLTTMPESLGQLTQLQRLDLHNNRLTAIPESLSQLTQLQILSLSNNRLTTMPKSLGRLTGLQRLDLSHNQLTELPESLGQLTQLRVLFLSANQLTRAVEAIDQLTQLQMLDLSGNRLTMVPQSLRRLTTLGELFLHDNPALVLPREVLGPTWEQVCDGMKPAKPAEILDYCFRVRGGTRPLNEAKLILLGRGEVGKTCLVNRLVHDRYVSTSMTCGIRITQWPVKVGGDTVRLHVWDFGGQEIQHATHQFFLTERSLYLVVLNGRAGVEDEDAEYWLKFVKTFGAGSATIVVLNKFKADPFQVNRRALKEKYPFIRAFVETDCKPNKDKGIAELKEQVNAALGAMEHVRADFPAGWFEIKDKLAGMKKPFISFGEYREICVKHGENDTEAQERLAGFLNALGIALNYRTDPRLREETVLNPHWITEGVYQIITNPKLAERQGELRPADLAGILPKKAYPHRMHAFVVELMRKFELCFPYHDDPEEHRYLVPELLGKEEPELKEPFQAKQCLNFRYEYRLMPEGLLPRFITRTHTMSQPAERWRTGVVLRWEGCRAMVKADKHEREVLVRVEGSPEKRRRLLAVIRENFDHIHSEMHDFRPTESVALEGHPTEWVAYEDLAVFEEKRSEMLKRVGGEVVPVDVAGLLDKTDVRGARQRDEMSVQAERPVRLFISYAREDEKWRNILAPNLALLQREGLVQVWHDGQIIAGTKWDDEIKRKLDDADLYLFLMSADLLSSEYVQKTELPIARKRHEENKARLVPVIVRRCGWQRYVGDIQGLPKTGQPVKQWRDRDEACFDIEQGLRATIAELRKMLGRF